MSDERMKNPVYLGDGVYLGDDGWQLWLAVDNHENVVIALDEDTFHELVRKGMERFKQIGGTR